MLAQHATCHATISLVVDASDKAIGAVVHQTTGKKTEPLGFFSKKLKSAEVKYSTYDWELLAIYEGIKHFRHLLDGRNFCVFTDHKPITFAFQQKSDKSYPSQARHLDLIAQYTTDIRHISGESNCVADLLSRINQINSVDIDFNALAIDQKSDHDLKCLIDNTNKNSSMLLKKIETPHSKDFIYCDTSTTKIRPIVTSSFRQSVIRKLYR